MKAKKETLKENVLTDIDELMDSLSVNPEHRNVKDSVKKPVFMWTDMPKLRNVELPKETGITGFSRPFRRAGEHYLRNVKFFMQIERGAIQRPCNQLPDVSGWILISYKVHLQIM